MANRFRELAEKKRAEENPALMFISQPQEEQEKSEQLAPEPLPVEKSEAPILQASGASKTTGRAVVPPRAPQGQEPKSRRLQLLLQPSLYEEIKQRAEAEGKSVNDEIGTLLRQALNE